MPGSLEQFTHLVGPIARSVRSRLPSNIELDDLKQVGMIGLWKALDRCDMSMPSHSVEAFLSSAIRGAMKDYLREADHLSRVERQRQKQYAAAEDEAMQMLGGCPTKAYLAKRLNVSLGELLQIEITAINGSLMHVDSTPVEGQEMTPLKSEEFTPEEMYAVKKRREAAKIAFNNLEEREKRIIEMHLINEIDYKDIGAIFGISVSRVCQIIKRTLTKVHKALHSH